MKIWKTIKNKWEDARDEYKADRAYARDAKSEARQAARVKRAEYEKKLAEDREQYRYEQRKKAIRGGGFAGAIQRYAQPSSSPKPRYATRKKKGKKQKVVYRYMREPKRPSLGDLI